MSRPKAERWKERRAERLRELAGRLADQAARPHPCGKKGYASDGEARLAMGRIRRRAGGPHTLRCYFCPPCGAYHLGRKQLWEAG